MVSTALIGFGGLAYADDDPTTSTPTSSEVTEPPPAEEPPVKEPVGEPEPPKDNEPADPPGEEEPQLAPPSVSTASACGEGTGFVDVTVTNPNDVEETYSVKLLDKTQELTVAAGGTEVASFDNVAGGEHDVTVSRGGEVVAESLASVDRCNEIEPVDDPLQVFVRCENGVGLVTIRVFDTDGQSRTYTVSVDDIEIAGEIELGANEYAVVIDEEQAPDGTYKIRVVAEGIDHTETVTVKCAPAPTTTTPPAQPRPAPKANDGGLASTGAAVGGLALFAVLALGLGGGLIVMSRRRRAATAQPEDNSAE